MFDNFTLGLGLIFINKKHTWDYLHGNHWIYC